MNRATALCCILFLYGGLTVRGQIIQQDQKISADTSSQITINKLLTPSLFPLFPVSQEYGDFTSSTPTIRLGTTAKFLLARGTDIIRGKAEDHSLYSLENAWKYPGPTVRYPETATEYELFLNRYRRYNPY